MPPHAGTAHIASLEAAMISRALGRPRHQEVPRIPVASDMPHVVRAALLLIALAFPAAASAQPLTLTVGKFDRQITRLPLTLACDPAAACEVKVRARWSMVNAETGE